MSNHHNRGKHTSVLEEIHEEQDSVHDENSMGSSQMSDDRKLSRKNGIRHESPEISMEDPEKLHEGTSKKISEEIADNSEESKEKRLSSSEMKDSPELVDNSNSNPHRYTRHLSLDRGSSLKTPQHFGNEEAIERYYERNNYTVTGRDVYNKLPFHLQHRMKAENNFDGTSRVSTPGALGETVVPSTRRFDKSMYWIAFHRKKIGFRHICVVLLVLFYTLIGAFMFYTVESRHEKSKTLRHVRRLEELLSSLAENITESVNNPQTTTNVTTMKKYIRDAYISLMKLEGQYKGSTYFKLEDPDKNWKWTFESAFFFSMNVYTTTGYGSIAPESDIGQFLVCIYGFIFVPVTLVALRDLGQFFLVHLTKIYAQGIQKFRELNGDKNIDEDEMIRLPISACLGLLAAYLAVCSIFIYFYDELSGEEPESGISLFLSFYFSFISLSTIGLGDIMPNNATFSPIISIMFFFGMALTKVVNRTTYIAVENGIFGTMTLLENKLDSVVSKTKVEEETPPKILRRFSVENSSIILNDEANANEILNNFTVRSIATFMKSNADIYGGGFGRVQLRRGDLMNENQSTVNSVSQLRHRTASQSKDPPSNV